MKKYRDKILDNDDKYSWAFVKIWLNYENNSWVNIKYVKDANKIVKILKKLCKASNLATWDKTLL